MSTVRPTVLLLHGLFNSPKWLFLLKNRLTKAGFLVKTFQYYSTKDDINTHIYRLNQYLIATHTPSTPLHIVAHSLGGLVARAFIATYPNWQIGRVVTLGTPHLGSVCADFGKRFLPFLLNRAYDNALDGHCMPLVSPVELGSIAGNRSLGLGVPVIKFYNKNQRVNTKFGTQNDGTVYVFETALPCAKDHLILPTTHLGLLHDKQVANQAIYFLENGRFFR